MLKKGVPPKKNIGEILQGYVLTNEVVREMMKELLQSAFHLPRKAYPVFSNGYPARSFKSLTVPS